MTQFEIRLRQRNIPLEDLLGDLNRCAEMLGKSSLTALEYDRHGSFNSTTVIRRFGTWNNALGQASLNVGLRMDITDAELFQNIADVWTRKGSKPSSTEIDGSMFGSRHPKSTYRSRFGSWNKALMAFADFIDRTNAGPDDIPENVGRELSARKSQRRTSREINWRLRAKVLIRDNCICQMCGNSPAKSPDTVLHVDHILAWANGGETLEENLQTLCLTCNIGKSDQFLPGQDAVA